MFAEPLDFDRERLAETVRDGWGFAVSSLRYEPVGFGTHHYLAQDETGARLFVNVDELAVKSWLAPDAAGALDALDRALRTAVALRRLGLEFVHAPMERADGGVVAVIEDRYAVSLFAFVDGRSNDFGEYTSDDERRLVLNALGRMHVASDRLPSGLVREDSLEIPLRQRFLEALDDHASVWTGGPYSEPARKLLADSAGHVRAMFDRYDELARSVRAAGDAWVVTHGEPHAANVMRTADEGLVLIDWDTAAIGPRERDLWMIEPKNDEDWAAYTSGGGTDRIDPTAIQLYRLWWALSEITGYTDAFRSPHEDDRNTQTAWAGLQTYLPSSDGAP